MCRTDLLSRVIDEQGACQCCRKLRRTLGLLQVYIASSNQGPTLQSVLNDMLNVMLSDVLVTRQESLIVMHASTSGSV